MNIIYLNIIKYVFELKFNRLFVIHSRKVKNIVNTLNKFVITNFFPSVCNTLMLCSMPSMLSVFFMKHFNPTTIKNGMVLSLFCPPPHHEPSTRCV